MEEVKNAADAVARYHKMERENRATPVGENVPHTVEQVMDARNLALHLARLELESRQYNRIRKPV